MQQVTKWCVKDIEPKVKGRQPSRIWSTTSSDMKQHSCICDQKSGDWRIAYRLHALMASILSNWRYWNEQWAPNVRQTCNECTRRENHFCRTCTSLPHPMENSGKKFEWNSNLQPESYETTHCGPLGTGLPHPTHYVFIPMGTGLPHPCQWAPVFHTTGHRSSALRSQSYQNVPVGRLLFSFLFGLALDIPHASQIVSTVSLNMPPHSEPRTPRQYFIMRKTESCCPKPIMYL